MALKSHLKIAASTREQRDLDVSRLTRDETLHRIGECAKEAALLQARLAQLLDAPAAAQQQQSAANADRLLTVKEAAERLGVSPQWLYQRWEKLGGIKLDAGTLRFPMSALDSYVRSLRK